MTETNNTGVEEKIRNFFTNEDPSEEKNTTGNYGIISGSVNPARIKDGFSDDDSGKFGSSIPSPLARLFLFSAALKEVNHVEQTNRGKGHFDASNPQNQPTQYDIIVGELLDMLEFIFKYGDAPDFHVKLWNLASECQVLERSGNKGHKNLASALRTSFDYPSFKGQPIYIFKWKDYVIGGSSPISLVYTSVNLGTVLSVNKLSFDGNAGNKLFNGRATPLHQRDKDFREYLYRLMLTDMQKLNAGDPLSDLSQYIQDSATNYDGQLYAEVQKNPSAYKNVKDVQSQGGNITVAKIQLKMTNHTVHIDRTTTDYLLKPTLDVSGDIPMVLTKQGVPGLIYAAGRVWKPDSDKIPTTLDNDIDKRKLPGFGNTKYPFLTVNDFFEDKVIEVSYQIDKDRFFTGCAGDEMSFLLPLKKRFFEYFTPSDLVDSNGQYTNMLTMVYDEERKKLTVELLLPLANGHEICLHKTYDISDECDDRLECFDGSHTFDFAMFPFYRLEPDTTHNVYNVMIGATVDSVSMTFYEKDVQNPVPTTTKPRTIKGNDGGSQLSTTHIRVNGAFTYIELNVK